MCVGVVVNVEKLSCFCLKYALTVTTGLFEYMIFVYDPIGNIVFTRDGRLEAKNTI